MKIQPTMRPGLTRFGQQKPAVPPLSSKELNVLIFAAYQPNKIVAKPISNSPKAYETLPQMQHQIGDDAWKAALDVPADLHNRVAEAPVVRLVLEHKGHKTPFVVEANRIEKENHEATQPEELTLLHQVVKKLTDYFQKSSLSQQFEQILA